MKVVWVKAGKLLPVDTGGKIRSYNILRYLAREHELTMLSYYDGAGDAEYEAALARELPGAKVINTAGPDANVFLSGLDYLYRLPRVAPYAVSKFTRSIVRSTVTSFVSPARRPFAVL